MVGNADIQAEQGGDRAQQALGLPPRPTKGQAQQVPGLDRHVRVIPRPTAPTRAGRAPGRDRLGRDPDRQLPPPLQRPVIFRPVLDPVARPWDLVAARLIEPVGHPADEGGAPYRSAAAPPKPGSGIFAPTRQSGGGSRETGTGCADCREAIEGTLEAVSCAAKWEVEPEPCSVRHPRPMRGATRKAQPAPCRAASLARV